MKLGRPVARVHSIRKALAPALFRHGKLVLSAVVMAMCFEAAAHADQMTWTLQSTYKYQVDVKLFSKSPRWAWPANGSYGLEDSGEHDATISCQHGQKICYGAWVTGRDDLIWGAGMDGNEACSDCCYPCGSSNPHVSFSN